MKVLRGIAKIMMLIGVLIILCTAGASDHGNISTLNVLLYGAIGLAVLVIGFGILYGLENK